MVRNIGVGVLVLVLAVWVLHAFGAWCVSSDGVITGDCQSGGLPGGTTGNSDWNNARAAGGMAGTVFPSAPNLYDRFLLVTDINAPVEYMWTGAQWVVIREGPLSSVQPAWQPDDSDTAKIGDGSINFNATTTTPGNETSQAWIQADCNGTTATRMIIDGCAAPTLNNLACTAGQFLTTDANGLLSCATP